MNVKDKESYYFPYIIDIIKQYQQGTFEYIKLIISLSTGSIALISLILRFLIDEPIYIELLWISTFLFLITIIIGVVAFNKWRRKIIDVLKAIDADINKGKTIPTIDFYWINQIVNCLSISFVFAIILLFSFIALNMF